MKFVTFLALYIASVALTAFAQTPTGTPTGTPTAAPTKYCYDSELRLKVKQDGEMKSRSCAWVARKATKQRCALGGGAMAAACPKTCGTCTTCADPASGFDGLRFRFDDNDGESIVRSCEWVANTSTILRCFLTRNICRETCQVCTA